MNLKKIGLHPSNDFETTTEHFKIKLRTIYPTEKPRKKMLFTLKEKKKKNWLQRNIQIKSFLSIKKI